MFTEKQLDRKKVFSGRIVDVYHDRVTLPDGREALREVCDHPGAVAILALDGEDSPYLTENCLLKDTETPVAEQVQKLFVLDKNNMASPETAESE